MDETQFLKWIADLDERCEKSTERVNNDLIVNEKNCRAMDGIFQILSKRCSNPFCLWPIQVLREKNYTAPFIGDICATCHDLYVAISIMNPMLKFSKYFHNAHDAWVKEQAELKNVRKRMGLDDGTT